MTTAETQYLTQNQNGQPQVVVVQPNQNPYYGQQNVKYVHVYPNQAGGQQPVYMQATDSQVARTIQQQEMQQYAAHGGQQNNTYQPQPASSPSPSPQAEVDVVQWNNFKLPIPQNHAKFMRKVFLTLTLQLIFTAGVIALCMYVPEINEWVVENWWMWIPGLFGGLCILCALMGARNNYPLNLCLLFLWTACMAYTVGMVCAAYAKVGMADMVMQAFGITVLVFLGLCLFSCQTKCNLMPLGMIAFMMLSVMFWWGWWALIFGWYNSSGWALMFIIIFCLLIMFDVWRMCNMPVFDEGAWILGAINLYLDVINLFLWILRFMAASQR